MSTATMATATNVSTRVTVAGSVLNHEPTPCASRPGVSDHSPTQTSTARPMRHQGKGVSIAPH